MNNFRTLDQRTIDSAGAFFVNELERLDQEYHGPLFETYWKRDIDLREDVGPGDESSSFTLSTFASVGSPNSTGKKWLAKNGSVIPAAQLDISKVVNPLTPWAMDLQYTVMELMSAQQIGRPVDSQKYQAIMDTHEMDIDAQVFLGDSSITPLNSTTPGVYGLFNSPLVPDGPALNGNWTTGATPNQILADINAAIYQTYSTSGFKVCPQECRIPPYQFQWLAATLVSTAGNMSILEFVIQNSATLRINGKPLNIQPNKWLTAGTGYGDGSPVLSSNRMVMYTKKKEYVRFPLVPMQRQPMQYTQLSYSTAFWCKLGVTEIVYPQTLSYTDGI